MPPIVRVRARNIFNTIGTREDSFLKGSSVPDLSTSGAIVGGLESGIRISKGVNELLDQFDPREKEKRRLELERQRLQIENAKSRNQIAQIEAQRELEIEAEKTQDILGKYSANKLERAFKKSTREAYIEVNDILTNLGPNASEAQIREIIESPQGQRALLDKEQSKRLLNYIYGLGYADLARSNLSFEKQIELESKEQTATNKRLEQESKELTIEEKRRKRDNPAPGKTGLSSTDEGNLFRLFGTNINDPKLKEAIMKGVREKGDPDKAAPGQPPTETFSIRLDGKTTTLNSGTSQYDSLIKAAAYLSKKEQNERLRGEDLLTPNALITPRGPNLPQSVTSSNASSSASGVAPTVNTTTPATTTTTAPPVSADRIIRTSDGATNIILNAELKGDIRLSPEVEVGDPREFIKPPNKRDESKLRKAYEKTINIFKKLADDGKITREEAKANIEKVRKKLILKFNSEQTLG